MDEIKSATDAIEKRVLAAMSWGVGGYDPEECAHHFCGIMDSTGLSRDYVRAACRALVDRGLARYQVGLFTEDGEVAGAGYGITKAGLASLQ